MKKYIMKKYIMKKYIMKLNFLYILYNGKKGKTLFS